MSDNEQPRNQGKNTFNEFDPDEYWRSYDEKATFSDYKGPTLTYEGDIAADQ